MLVRVLSFDFLKLINTVFATKLIETCALRVSINLVCLLNLFTIVGAPVYREVDKV